MYSAHFFHGCCLLWVDKPPSSCGSLSLLGSYLERSVCEVEVVGKISPPGTSCGLLHWLPRSDPDLLGSDSWVDVSYHGWGEVVTVGWSGGYGPCFCLCPLQVCASVSVCLPHVHPLLRPSVQFSSLWLPESSQGKCYRDMGLEREQGLGCGQNLSLRWQGSGCPGVLLCPDKLSGFFP